MTPIQNTLPILSKAAWNQATSWKETLLISAVGLAALSAFVQIFVGSFTSLVIYSFLGTAAYLGYLAQENRVESKRREEYYLDLKKNTEELRKEKLSFQEENKQLFLNNEKLKEQIDFLSAKLHSMQELFVKMDTSANLTKELLTTCMDVSSDQKLTESRIQILLSKLEQGNFIGAQKEIEGGVKKLLGTLHSIEKEIKQFFLHDSKGTRLLEIKKEFVEANRDLQKVKEELEKVQKQLLETSARLEKTSYEIEAKINQMKEEEKKLSSLKNLTPIVLKFLTKQEVRQQLSLKEEEQFKVLQKNWQSLVLPS